MNINISVSGADFNTDDMEKRAAEAVESAARLVVRAARELCPVDTGALRESIDAESDGMSAVITAGAEYAAYVEFGTSKSAAQPYLVPALLQNKEALAEKIAETLLT